MCDSLKQSLQEYCMPESEGNKDILLPLGDTVLTENLGRVLNRGGELPLYIGQIPLYTQCHCTPMLLEKSLCTRHRVIFVPKANRSR